MCLFLYIYAWQLAMNLIKWKQLTAKNALKNTAKCNTFTVVHAKSPNKSLQNLNCIGQSTISRYIIQLQSFAMRSIYLKRKSTKDKIHARLIYSHWVYKNIN